MATANSEWKQLCENASALMRDALQKEEGFGRPLHRKKAFGQVVDFFENNLTIADPNLRDDIYNLLMEVGGSGPKYYEELLELFESRASEDDIKRYFES